MGERVAIVGSRGWPEGQSHRVTEYVLNLPAGTVVVSGGAKGVDSMAERVAERCGLDVHTIPADWLKHGRAAGPICNSEIVAACDRVVAFWDGESRGTADTIRKAKRAGKPVAVYRPYGVTASPAR
jgi:hypothetical protein